MFTTLYFIVTRIPDSLRSDTDHFLSLDPTSLTVDLLEEHLLTAETSAVAVGAAHGTPRPPFFEGCSPSPLAPSYASAAAADIRGAEDVGAASASAKRRSSKGKGGRGGGGGSGSGGGGSNGGSGGGGGGGGGGTGGGGGGSGGGGGGSGGSGGSGGGGTGGGRTGAWRGGSGGGQRQQQQRRSETYDSCPYVIRTGDRAGQTCGRLHTQHRCFSRVDDAWRAEFGDEVERPRWADLLRSGVAICDLDFDVILSAMYALSSGTLPGTAPPQALHTFALDLGASRCFFRDSTTLTPLPAPVPVRLADPSGGPVIAHSPTVLSCPASVSICTCTRTGRHLAMFTRRPGSSLYTLATEPPQVAASAQVSASGQVTPPCSYRLVTHQTLLWHHLLGHPSLTHLRGMHSRLLVSGLLRSLPPLLPSPAPPCLPCVEGRQRAAPHSSSFPPTTAPLQSLHMDVWCPARVSGQGREHYFLLVVDDYTRGGEFSFDLLRDFCRWEGILQSFRLLDSPQQNGIAERRIGLVMEVARTSMIHAAAPHFLWPFAVRYAAHQLNLWHRVSLPETSPTLRWTGKVGDASVFRVLGSRAFVRDTSTDKLSAPAIPCVFLGFVPDAPGWQFYHPTSRSVLPSIDFTFDKSVPFYHLFPYRSAPLPPPRSGWKGQVASHPLQRPGGEFSFDLLRDFCRWEGILQSFRLLDSPQQNGIAERRIGLVMEVARTSMIHAAAPHFLWPFAVRYAAHQLNLWPRVSLPKTSPTLRWTGKVGDASVFRVLGSRAFVRDTSTDKLSAPAIPCVFLGFVPDAPGWQFYHPTSRSVLPSIDFTFDKSVPFYHLFPYRSAPLPPPPLFLAPCPPPVDPLPPQDPAPSGVSQVDPPHGAVLGEVALDSGAARGTASGGAEPGGAEPGGAEPGGAERGGTKTGGAETRGAEPEGVEPGGDESEGADSGGAEPQGAASSGATGAGGAGAAGARGAGVTAGAGVPGGTASTGLGGARTRVAGAGGSGAGGARAGGAGVGGTGAGGAAAGGAGAVDPRGTVQPRPNFVPLL
ncbi:unnamed protein product [Closterium sp. NIES-53]